MVIGRKTKEVSRNAHCSVWPLSKICIAENRFNSLSVGRIKAVVTRAGLGMASSPLSGLFPGAESWCWQGPERTHSSAGMGTGTEIPAKPRQSQGSRSRGWRRSKAPRLSLGVNWGKSAERKEAEKQMRRDDRFSFILQPTERTDPTWCWTGKGRGRK